MVLKQAWLDVALKGARGFVGEAYLVRSGVFAAAQSLAPGYVSLKPGEETAVPVTVSDLPANADVKTISARLLVDDDASSSSAPDETTVNIQKEGQTRSEAEGTFHLKVEMPTRPRNVAIKLDQGDIFWTFAGTLANDSYDLPDFAAQVNAYLDKLNPEGNQITLRFLVKSDSPGKVKIEITNKTLSRIQTQTWENPLDETFRPDRNLQLDYGMIEAVPLKGIFDQNKNQLSPTRIKMDIGGEIGPERIFGNVEAHDGKEFATISNDYSLAQSFTLDTPLHCVGMSGYFQTEAEAELYLELQNDMNGVPAAGSPLAKSNLALAPAEENVKQPWTFAGFENPVDLSAATIYWLVIKTARGRVRLGLQARAERYLQQARVNRGGQLWKGFGRASDPAGLLRLVYLPEIDNQTAGVEIGLAGMPRWQRFDPEPEAQTVSFDLPNLAIKKPAVIVIKSHARGTLSIANVIQEY